MVGTLFVSYTAIAISGFGSVVLTPRDEKLTTGRRASRAAAQRRDNFCLDRNQATTPPTAATNPLSGPGPLGPLHGPDMFAAA